MGNLHPKVDERFTLVPQMLSFSDETIQRHKNESQGKGRIASGREPHSVSWFPWSNKKALPYLACCNESAHGLWGKTLGSKTWLCCS